MRTSDEGAATQCSGGAAGAEGGAERRSELVLRGNDVGVAPVEGKARRNNAIAPEAEEGRDPRSC
jgi:hypothetical protein